MLSTFINAFALGLALCAPIGPVFAATVRYGLSHGYQAALSVQFGSLAGDLLWAVIGLFGIGILAQIEPLRPWLGIAGALCLFWLGLGAIHKAWHYQSQTGPSRQGTSGYLVGAVLSLSNVNAILNWVGLGALVVTINRADSLMVGNLVFLLGYMSAAALWCFAAAGIVATGRRLLGHAGIRLLYALIGAILLSIGAVAIHNVV